jgi:hypothetical protein
MIIEFADPGYNWLWVWLPVAFSAVTIVAMILLYPLWDDMVAPLAFPAGLALILCPTLGAGTVYGVQVSDLIEDQLTLQGFSDVQLVGDRFTAATEDGKYFSGVLVDLDPESGYAYQVLELTGTEK